MLVSPERTIRELHSQGLWGDTTLSDLFFRNVAQHGDRTALVDAPNRASLVDGPAKRLSYRELGAQTRILAPKSRYDEISEALAWAISRLGGAPKKRLNSRLNCDGLP